MSCYRAADFFFFLATPAGNSLILSQAFGLLWRYRRMGGVRACGWHLQIAHATKIQSQIDVWLSSSIFLTVKRLNSTLPALLLLREQSAVITRAVIRFKWWTDKCKILVSQVHLQVSAHLEKSDVNLLDPFSMEKGANLKHVFKSPL